jgi:hypothetical protein
MCFVFLHVCICVYVCVADTYELHPKDVMEQVSGLFATLYLASVTLNLASVVPIN